jgi:hypothetical protein
VVASVTTYLKKDVIDHPSNGPVKALE